jgi:hypothetical protein
MTKKNTPQKAKTWTPYPSPAPGFSPVLFWWSRITNLFSFLWGVFFGHVSYVPNGASVSGLSILNCPFGFLWIVFVLCLVSPMLPVSLDCLRPVSCRDTGNIRLTRHRTKTIQRHWQHWAHKTQNDDNPETLAILGSQDTGRRQSRDTGNIGLTRHRTKTNKNTTQHRRWVTQIPPKTGGETCDREG